MPTGVHYWPQLLDMSEDQCKVKLRCMELEAYSNIVSVMRARGPLTEEKLNFMKQCSKEFHISQERHKVEIRKASNDELLNTIAEVLYGPNTLSKWFIEGRRLAPVINTEPRQSVYIELANRMAEIARAQNASLPPYSEYKDDDIEVDISNLKFEEDALMEDLEKAVKSQKAAVAAQETVTPSTPEHTQIIEVTEADSKGEDDEDEEEDEASAAEGQATPMELSDSTPLPPSSGGGDKQYPRPAKDTLGGKESSESTTPPKKDGGGSTPPNKSPQGRRKKRSLSIEMFKDDGSCTPPKRFSNIPPPRIPATPVSQRPPRFHTIPGASSQPSPRIVVLPGSMHQQHSSMTQINTGSAGTSVRKPLLKQSAPPPPIISKIQRPRMFTPMKTLNYTPAAAAAAASSNDSPGGSKPSSAGETASSALTAKTSGAAKGNNVILVQKNKPAAATTLPNRITIANPSKKQESLSKFLVNKPGTNSTQTPQPSPSGAKPVYLKSTGSSSQNNVILVDITQDQLSGSLSVEDLLKVSGLSSTPGTVTHTPGGKASASPLPSIIKLQNPKSLGSLPANIQQIKIIKSSGSKVVFPTSAGCTMETVLSLAQSSTGSTSNPLYTSSPASGAPRMIIAPLANTRPPLKSPRPLLPLAQRSSTSTGLVTSSAPMGIARTPTGIVTSSSSLVQRSTATGVVTSSTPLGVSRTPTGTLVTSSTPIGISRAPTGSVSSAGGQTSRAPSVATSAGSQRPSTSSSGGVQTVTSSQNSSSSISSGSQLADWLSNYVVSDKDIETDNSPLFEEVTDKSHGN